MQQPARERACVGRGEQGGKKANTTRPRTAEAGRQDGARESDEADEENIGSCGLDFFVILGLLGLRLAAQLDGARERAVDQETRVAAVCCLDAVAELLQGRLGAWVGGSSVTARIARLPLVRCGRPPTDLQIEAQFG